MLCTYIYMEVVKGNTSDKIGNPDIKLQVQNLFLGLTKILSVEWPSSAFLPLIYYKSFRYVSINFLIWFLGSCTHVPNLLMLCRFVAELEVILLDYRYDINSGNMLYKARSPIKQSLARSPVYVAFLRFAKI